MGDRFLTLRLDSCDEDARNRAAVQAMANNGKEAQMRRELREAMHDVLSNLPGKPKQRKRGAALATIIGDEKTAHVESELLEIASLVTRARTAVEMDRHGNVEYAHAPEMPTRFLKQLVMLFRGALIAGMTYGEARDLTLRVARDCMPPHRRFLLRRLLIGTTTVAEVCAQEQQLSSMTARRNLEALRMLGLVVRSKDEEVEKAPYEYTLLTRWETPVRALFKDELRTIFSPSCFTREVEEVGGGEGVL
jgi:hypothetical protein